ncbi:MAG: MBL fold metallo-hydrolase [Pseudomonadota bacterium]
MDGSAEAEAQIRFPFAVPPAVGEATEVAPGVLWMRLPLPMKLDHVNAYALDDGDAWTLVDTGVATSETKAIWDGLLSGPLGGRPVARIIVTHHHPDHVGMAGWLMERTGAPLLMTRTAWLYARMLTLDVQERPTAEAMTFYRAGGMAPELLAKRAASRPMNFADCVVPLPLGFQRLAEGDRLKMGGREWAVRTGHGHAPEHATFWAEDIALVGDQILPGISSNLGVYPTEPEADTVTDWLESCRRLRTASKDELVLPGHNLPFRGVRPRLDQLIENHDAALARLLDALETPRTAAECFDALYRRPIGAGEYGLALAEAVGHVNHLHALGRLKRERRDDGAWLWHRVD